MLLSSLLASKEHADLSNADGTQGNIKICWTETFKVQTKKWGTKGVA